MNNVIKIVFVIIGTVIGAGFASGQEIYTFFYSYGIKGLLGLVICSVLLSIIMYKVLKILIENKNIENYKEFLDEIIQNKLSRKYLNVKFVLNNIINIFLLITFYIMVAGFGAYFAQELQINNLIGCVIIALLSFIVLMTSVKGVIKVNEILTPILIIFITTVGIMNFIKLDLESAISSITVAKNYGWFISSILYCSYNSILLIPVLITLSKIIKNKKQAQLTAIISGGIILIISVCIFFMLTRIDIDVAKLEMPVVYVISNFFKNLKKLYGLIILSSIFTTTISIGVSLLENISKDKISYTQIALIMCITSVPISKIGFSNLIVVIYPFFGLLGIYQIYKIILKK